MIEESPCYPLRAAQAGNAFQKDFVVILASFCIMGGPRSSRAHLSFSRGELGWASVPTKPCPGTGVTVGTAGLPLERNFGAQGGEIKPSPRCKEGSDRRCSPHAHGAAELALPPLGAKIPCWDTWQWSQSRAGVTAWPGDRRVGRAKGKQGQTQFCFH